MTNGCIMEVRRQIQIETNASITYLAMGAHFAEDTVNLPGFSEFFIKVASEEREHAIKLIQYLLMRGELASKISDLIKVNVIYFLSHFQDFFEIFADCDRLIDYRLHKRHHGVLDLMPSKMHSKWKLLLQRVFGK